MGNDQIKRSAFPDKEMQEDKRDCDANTEIKEHTVNAEWIDEQHHHFDLQKQGTFTKKNHIVAQEVQQAGQCELPVVNAEQQILNELPKITMAKNPEVRQESMQIKNKTIVEENKTANIDVVSPPKQVKIPQAQSNVPLYEDNKHIIRQPETQLESMYQQLLYIDKFSSSLKSSTISLNQSLTIATQTGSYWQNKKLILSQPIKNRAKAIFRVRNLKYCVGMGIALKEIIEKHDFNYKSYENQLSHGLFLVTSQGYSWSHAYKTEDDTFRPQFKKMANNDQISVTIQKDTIIFIFKQASFSLSVPETVLKKYTLCFCAYLHEKSDSISLVPQNPVQAVSQ